MLNRLSVVSIVLLASLIRQPIALAEESAGESKSEKKEAEPKEEKEEEENKIVVGIGGAGEYAFKENSIAPGGNIMFEASLIEGWLTLGLSVSALKGAEGAEVPIDLLIKKPFKLAPAVEMIVGIGPEFLYVSTAEGPNVFVGGELAVGFLFWPSKHVGFWIEPAYDLVAKDGLSQSIAVSGGVLIGW